MNKARGFSLIEIMVVVAIIGLLASYVVPNVMGALESARHQKIVSDISSIDTALKLYMIDNGVYPTMEQGVEALMKKTDISPEPSYFRNGGYLSKKPLDPWDNAYVFENPADEHPYDIYTLGADGVRGGVGEAMDISLWSIKGR